MSNPTWGSPATKLNRPTQLGMDPVAAGVKARNELFKDTDGSGKRYWDTMRSLSSIKEPTKLQEARNKLDELGKQTPYGRREEATRKRYAEQGRDYDMEQKRDLNNFIAWNTRNNLALQNQRGGMPARWFYS